MSHDACLFWRIDTGNVQPHVFHVDLAFFHYLGVFDRVHLSDAETFFLNVFGHQYDSRHDEFERLLDRNHVCKK